MDLHILMFYRRKTFHQPVLRGVCRPLFDPSSRAKLLGGELLPVEDSIESGGEFRGGAKPYWTGIAMYNPNAADINVTLQVYSEKGIETGAATIRLAGGTRVVGVQPQLVPAISEQLRGYVRASSDRGPVVAFELFGDREVSFLAAVPPQAVHSQY